MNRTNGFVELADIVLLEDGLIRGTVRQQDQDPAGAGVQVRLFEAVAGTPTSLVATDVTVAGGGYEFRHLKLGDYVVEASAPDGNRGRKPATLAASGQELTADVVYLGRGTLDGVVRDGSDNPVETATVTLYTYSIFGSAAPISRAVDAGGTFTFPNVLIGNFTIQAHDIVTNQAASVAGAIASHGQTVTEVVKLSSYELVDGRRHWSGRLVSFEGDVAGVRLEKEGGALAQVPFDKVAHGRLEVEFK